MTAEIRYNPEKSLAHWAENNSDLVNQVFRATALVLDEVLPGSNYHVRYKDVDAIGLAIAIADDEGLVDFDPHYTPTFWESDNRNGRNSGAWEWKETDDKTLGLESLPDEVLALGRFFVVAEAKIEHLFQNPDLLSSFEVESPEVGKWEVGFAGARRTNEGSIISTSGLWEVHDHVVSAVFGLALDSIRKSGKKTFDAADYEILRQILNAEIDNVHDMVIQSGASSGDKLERSDVGRLVDFLDYTYIQIGRLAASMDSSED